MLHPILKSALKYVMPLLIAGASVFVAAPASAKNVGCVGKMWNPVTDLDFRLMGGLKIWGDTLMEIPKLGEPPEHTAPNICYCQNGMKSGWGFGITYWMPSYIMDMARQGGCIGFLNGVNIMEGFISESSGQEYNQHSPGKEGVTTMQVHWAYADVVSMAGKSLFEKCGETISSFGIGYLTEPDFVFQNDVYSVMMTPQASIIAEVPFMAMLTCGYENIANTLGDWQNWGVCAWQGSLYPLSGNAISKNSAQVSNMDIAIKYLSRAALMGTVLRTMGEDALCEAQYSPIYDPFQHRFQWSYPRKVSTRYNEDVMAWGLFIKDQRGATSMAELANDTNETKKVDTTSGSSSGSMAGLAAAAEKVMASVPTPLNYPTREAGYMHVWEAKQCCLIVVTVQDILKMIITSYLTGGQTLVNQLYEAYNVGQKIYAIMQNPVFNGMAFVASFIGTELGMSQGAADLMGKTLASITEGVMAANGAASGANGGGPSGGTAGNVNNGASSSSSSSADSWGG